METVPSFIGLLDAPIQGSSSTVIPALRNAVSATRCLSGVCQVPRPDPVKVGEGSDTFTPQEPTF